MKKLLRFTTLLSFALFFVNFLTYQGSTMPKAKSISFFKLLTGMEFAINANRRLIADGQTGSAIQVFNSGFNAYALAAVICAAAGILCAWGIKKSMALRITVFVTTVSSLVFFIMAAGRILEGSAFWGTLNDRTDNWANAVRGGVEIKQTLMFSVIIAIMALSAVVTLTTEKFTANLVRYKWHYAMLAPCLAFLIVFAYIPMVGISISFVDFNLQDIWQSTWAGGKWFAEIWKGISGNFGEALANTLIIAVFRIAVNFPAPIILAVLINDCRSKKYKRVVQTVSYLPSFISWSIVFGLFIALFSSQYSVINGLLAMNGNSTGLFVLNEARFIRGTLVFTQLWKGVGWASIVYIAALTGVNPELYESARLDGAGKLAQIRHISLPGISAIITIQLIFAVAGLLGDNFDQVMAFVNPLTIEKGRTLSMYTYDVGIRGQGVWGLSGSYSFTTAVGLCNSVIAMLLLLGANTFARKFNPDGAVL